MTANSADTSPDTAHTGGMSDMRPPQKEQRNRPAKKPTHDLRDEPGRAPTQQPEQTPVHPVQPDTIAAVIVTWHTGPRLFDSVASALNAPDIDQLILVDNGNTRETRQALTRLRESNPKMIILWGHGNVGFGAGCNLGAAAATTSHVLFLNPDAMVTPGLAAELLRAGQSLIGQPPIRPWPTRQFPAGPHNTQDASWQPWLVGGRVMGLDGREQRGCRRGEVTLWRAVVEFTGLKAFGHIHHIFQSLHYETAPLPTHPAPMPTVSGACMLLRCDDFHRLGGFDEDYFLHVEDVDLCRRVRDAGGVVGFAPKAEVIHEGATSAASPLIIGWHKGRSFATYFRKFARSPIAKIAAHLVPPLIIAAALLHGVAKTFAAMRR